jgi:excinuclease ABC subunit C
MQEVVGRYFMRRIREGRDLPDLVLIDGGRGQLGAALQGLGAAGASDLPVAALAKRFEEVWLPGRDRAVVFEGRDPALHWLQRARDEAHRFALGYNRLLRRKRTLRSVLREVPGVGPARETELLRRFGSPAGVAQRSVDELAAVPGIGRVTARRILEALRSAPGERNEEDADA